MRSANSIRKPRRRPEKTRLFYLVCGFLVISLASSLSFAKGPTTKITIEGPRHPDHSLHRALAAQIVKPLPAYRPEM